MKRWFYYGGSAIVVSLILGLGACGRKEPPIATIDGKPLNQDEYVRRTEQQLTPIQVIGTQLVTQPAGYAAMLQMIREQILIEMAQQEGVMPTDQQVEERVQRTMRENPQVKQAITERKQFTLEDLRRETRFRMIHFNLLTKGVTVTEQEVKKFYEDNKQRFYRPATVMVRTLVVRDPKVRQQIDEDLKRGFNFRSIVQKYSQNPAAGVQSGETEITMEGPVDNTPQGQAFLRVRQALQNLKPGAISDWISFGQEQVRMEVITRNSGRQLPYEEVKETIREQLMLQKSAQTGRDLNLEIAKRMANAKIEVLYPKWKEQFTKDMEQLKKAVEELEKQQKQTGQKSAEPQATQQAGAR